MITQKAPSWTFYYLACAYRTHRRRIEHRLNCADCRLVVAPSVGFLTHTAWLSQRLYIYLRLELNAKERVGSVVVSRNLAMVTTGVQIPADAFSKYNSFERPPHRSGFILVATYYPV